MKCVLIITRVLPVFLIVSSCQREISEKIPNPTGNNNSCSSSLLIKIAQKSLSDSAVTEFSYEANGRMSKRFTQVFGSQNPGTHQTIILRDASGMITQLVTRWNYLQGGLDTTYINVFYEPTTHRYTHTTEQFEPFGYITRDSIVFMYDGIGRLIGQQLYAHHFTPGPYYILDSRTEYTYNSDGTVSVLKIYSRDQTTNIIDLETIIEYSYDDKKRAQRSEPGDAIILSDPVSNGSHNVISQKETNFKFPIYNATYTSAITYNNCDLPSTLVSTSSGSNYYLKVYYYYK